MKNFGMAAILAITMAIGASLPLTAAAQTSAADEATGSSATSLGCPLGMLNYWRFDEGMGTTAFDSVGIQHGEVLGAQWIPGLVSNALSFDGSNDSIDVPNSPDWVFDSFTIEVWVRMTEADAHRGTVLSTFGSSWTSTGFSIGIGGETANRWGYVMEVSYRTVPGPPKVELGSLAAGVRVDDNEWHLIAFVRDHEIGKAFLYIDSAMVQESDDMDGTLTVSRDLTIGDQLWQGMHIPFAGAMDEVAIYNRALPVDEIGKHYVNGLAGKDYCYVSPAEALEALIDDIEAMGLQTGTENSLVAKLDNALKSLEKGKEEQATHGLQAFIDKVEAQRGKKLTEEQADQLITAAEEIIAMIAEDLE